MRRWPRPGAKSAGSGRRHRSRPRGRDNAATWPGDRRSKCWRSNRSPVGRVERSNVALGEEGNAQAESIAPEGQLTRPSGVPALFERPVKPVRVAADGLETDQSPPSINPPSAARVGSGDASRGRDAPITPPSRRLFRRSVHGCVRGLPRQRRARPELAATPRRERSSVMPAPARATLATTAARNQGRRLDSEETRVSSEPRQVHRRQVPRRRPGSPGRAGPCHARHPARVKGAADHEIAPAIVLHFARVPIPRN